MVDLDDLFEVELYHFPDLRKSIIDEICGIRDGILANREILLDKHIISFSSGNDSVIISDNLNPEEEALILPFGEFLNALLYKRSKKEPRGWIVRMLSKVFGKGMCY